jgi:hypothetical protein
MRYRMSAKTAASEQVQSHCMRVIASLSGPIKQCGHRQPVNTCQLAVVLLHALGSDIPRTSKQACSNPVCRRGQPPDLRCMQFAHSLAAATSAASLTPRKKPGSYPRCPNSWCRLTIICCCCSVGGSLWSAALCACRVSATATWHVRLDVKDHTPAANVQ